MSLVFLTANDITPDILQHLDEALLKELVPSVGIRIRLREDIKKYVLVGETIVDKFIVSTYTYLRISGRSIDNIFNVKTFSLYLLTLILFEKYLEKSIFILI